MSGFRAILAGATGLVGGECLKRLLASEHYSQVVVVTRRRVELPGRHPKLRQAVVEFDQLGDVRDRLAGDHVFCALGTTTAIGMTASFLLCPTSLVLLAKKAAR